MRSISGKLVTHLGGLLLFFGKLLYGELQFPVLLADGFDKRCDFLVNSLVVHELGLPQVFSQFLHRPHKNPAQAKGNQYRHYHDGSQKGNQVRRGLGYRFMEARQPAAEAQHISIGKALRNVKHLGIQGHGVTEVFTGALVDGLLYFRAVPVVFHFGRLGIAFVNHLAVPIYQGNAQVLASKIRQARYGSIRRIHLAVGDFNEMGCFPQVPFQLLRHFVLENLRREIHRKESGEYSDINQAEADAVFHRALYPTFRTVCTIEPCDPSF